jgi:hypothetical protein
LSAASAGDSMHPMTATVQAAEPQKELTVAEKMMAKMG